MKQTVVSVFCTMTQYIYSSTGTYNYNWLLMREKAKTTPLGYSLSICAYYILRQSSYLVTTSVHNRLFKGIKKIMMEFINAGH